MNFPAVSGSNLLRQPVQLPAGLRPGLSLLFVPFQQWQQLEVNSWVALASQLEQTNPNFHFYELPTIQRMNFLARGFINEGMRAGIPDPATRARTITLYIDKKAFMRSLEMPDEAHTYLLLTDQSGAILWRARGPYSPETAADLQNAIRAFQPGPAGVSLAS